MTSARQTPAEGSARRPADGLPDPSARPNPKPHSDSDARADPDPDPSARPDPPSSVDNRQSSGRREQLLELAYEFVKEHGLADMSLRPLASAIGSSPRVLLFLFGSKDELIGDLLRRARCEELAFIGDFQTEDVQGLAAVVERTWRWLADPGNRSLLVLWTEAYGRSLTDPSGPWAGFAADTVRDWSDLLAAAQPPEHRRSAAGAAERTLALAVLRGALLDLLATGDLDRATAAIELAVRALPGS